MESQKFFGEIPIRRSRGLSRKTIENIQRQKEEYSKYAMNQNELIWKDPYFRSGPLLDKLADFIAEGIVKQASNLLEETCDEFIDFIVQSEFFPNEE